MNRKMISWTVLSVSLSLSAFSDAAGTSKPSHPGCQSDADCNDNNACTWDTCLTTGACTHGSVWTDDSDPCTVDGCNPSTGVTHTPLTYSGAVDPQCQIAPTCHKAWQWTSATAGQYVASFSAPTNKPNGTACSDGSGCTLNDACQSGACTGTPASGTILFETRPYVPTCASGSWTSSSSVGTVPASAALSFGASSSFSVGFWASFTSGTNQHLLVKGDNSTNEWSLTYVNGQLDFNRQGLAVLALGPVSAGAWHYYTVTYAAGSIVLYEDGAQVGAGTGNVGGAVMSQLHVGNYAAGSNGLLGQMNDLAIWSKALTPADVASLANKTKTPAVVGSLAAEWPLADGTGTTAADSSGNGHAMSLSGVGWSNTCYAGGSLTSTAQAISTWNSLPANAPGYGSTTVNSLSSWSNQSTVGGGKNNIAYHIKADVIVGNNQVGQWGFRVGPDFGYGGTIVVDGTQITAQWSSMYWSGNFNNPAQSLTGYVNLSAGAHVVEVYGFEDCCDGAGTLQFTAPGGSSLWAPISKSASNACF